MQTGKRDVGNLLRRQDDLRSTWRCGGGISDKRSRNLGHEVWRNRLSAKWRRVPSRDRLPILRHARAPAVHFLLVIRYLLPQFHLGRMSLLIFLSGAALRTRPAQGSSDGCWARCARTLLNI